MSFELAAAHRVLRILLHESQPAGPDRLLTLVLLEALSYQSPPVDPASASPVSISAVPPFGDGTVTATEASAGGFRYSSTHGSDFLSSPIAVRW